MYMTQVDGFTVALFELNNEAKMFKNWFDTTNYKRHFSVDFADNDGTDVLEVMQHNPYFDVNALYEVYLMETAVTEDENVEEL